MSSREHITNKTRYIVRETAQMLWAVSSGRCEFEGCNKILFKHHVTGSHGNFSEKAHIYAFSQGGRRFSPKFLRSKINDFDNLMLVCGECHKEIDADKNEIYYPAEKLIAMKRQHESRINLISGIAPEKKTLLVKYSARVGTRERITLHDGILNNSVMPAFYPAKDYPIDLSPDISLYDHQEKYWEILSDDLKSRVTSIQRDLQTSHISLFAVAPQPLLFLLGTLFDRSKPAEVRQPVNGAVDNWAWNDTPLPFEFTIGKKGTSEKCDNVALTIGLTCAISDSEIKHICGDIPIYSISCPSPATDCIQSKEHLSRLAHSFRQLLNQIRSENTPKVCIHLFIVAPASVAVQLGRHWMEKGDPTIVIYDRNQHNHGLHRTLTFGGQHADN